MEQSLADEIIACLPNERTLYYYYRDRYSIGLLRHLSRQSQNQSALNIAALRHSGYASLLQKPRVKTVLAKIGHQLPDEQYWQNHDYDQKQETFVLTLDQWGRDGRRNWQWRQTSRPGVNLVLQMNFSGEHDREYAKLKADDHPFASYCHPICDKRNTLAWARIDLDLHNNCALIEEIQNDWLREVAWLEKRVTKSLAEGRDPNSETKWMSLKCSLKTSQQYCRFVLDRYASLWDEAMLWAAISFLREEIGIRHIFYHSFESGKLLKHMSGSLPPRSLYTDLPKRFCFTPTEETPSFLEKEKIFQKIMRKNEAIRFFKMPEPILQAA